MEQCVAQNKVAHAYRLAPAERLGCVGPSERGGLTVSGHTRDSRSDR